MSAPHFSACLPLSDLVDRESKAVTVGGIELLLCLYNGQVFAIANRCSHADEPLSCGRVRNGWIACPAHGARFDLETGEVLGPPAIAPIRSFPVRVIEGMIEVAA